MPIVVCRECRRPMAHIKAEGIWHCAWCPRAIPIADVPFGSRKPDESTPDGRWELAFGALIYAVANYRDAKISGWDKSRAVLDAAEKVADCHHEFCIGLPLIADAVDPQVSSTGTPSTRDTSASDSVESRAPRAPANTSTLPAHGFGGHAVPGGDTE
jgi:hypothetical protein